MTTQCETLEDKLLDLIYGELPDTEAASLRAHADSCESCGKSLAKLTSARRLAKALPLEEPRPELTVAIMEKARSAMKAARPMDAVRADAPPPRAARGEQRTFWSTLAAKLGTFLVGPQAAMAAVTVLMVGIGIYYFPRLQTHEPVHGGRTVDPDPMGEAGPSAEIEPAAPLDLRYDPRTRRIVDARDVRPAPTVPQRPQVDQAQDNANGAGATVDQLQELAVDEPTRERTGENGEGRSDGTVTAVDHQAVLAPGVQGAQGQPPLDRAGRVVQSDLGEANLERDRDGDGIATLDIAPGQTVRSGGEREHATARRAQPQPGARNAVGDLAALRADVPSDDAVPTSPSVYETPAMQRQVAQPTPPMQPSPAPPVEAQAQLRLAPPPPGTADQIYRQGAQPSTAPRAQTNTYANVPGSSGLGATGGRANGIGTGSAGGGGSGSTGGAYYGRPTTDSTGTQVAAPRANDAQLAAVALHHRAMSEMSTAPQAAIRDFVSLLTRYPQYPESARAMLQLAEMYRRTGEVGQARVWVARAESSPVARDDARRMRVQLDEMDRAVHVPEAASNRAAESSAGSSSAPTSSER